MTTVYEIDPLRDARWGRFLEQHRLATIFHSPEWLAALQRSYGYRVAAVTTCSPWESLSNALVFCQVRSWATGSRLVSIPFSDHCIPLVENEDQFKCLVSRLKEACDRGVVNHLEIRSADSGIGGMVDSASFCLHRLDLGPSLDELFHTFHESCIRRKIRRAVGAGLTCEEGASEGLLRKFYQLIVLTRRRHQIPPQPFFWFRNLIACLGRQAKIRLACYNGEPAAGILTLRFKATITYKYCASDAQFHRYGPVQLLIWNAIREAKEDGLQWFDMGRTDFENQGLLTFKDHWGGKRSGLTYLRYPKGAAQSGAHFQTRIAKVFFASAPTKLLTTAGNLLYRHID